ncbi:uncharacterized protein PSFLO_06989 [Pseudozyma flocculosa]|uniref:Pali-domain-containing protein n=1 Tax=Pseudozyma flocculosa TaxID=84751 RepID=A0A5C3FCZ9_9BASI|nr:uncharacterized protein PSFLO_06989 [Pseudozyma flocculosa]
MFSAATPGTVLTFAAAVLLGLVTISTPIWDSIYFLKAIIGGQGGQRGQTATLGVLGYCIGSKCSSPTIGYNFDPNELLGISIISAKYTSAVIKGLTYTLVLHPIALGLAAIAFLFGLLSHCRPASRNCMGMCFSGIATAITVIAFGLDLALFIVAKKRIDSVDGASADLGVGLWMTLAAAILLFLSGFAFCCGCGGRGRGPSRGRVKDEYAGGYGQRPDGAPRDAYAEEMRMQALQAENDRMRRQAAGGTGDLPKFAEYETEYEVPLKRDYDEGAYDGPATAHHDLGYGSAAGQASTAVPGVGAGYGRREPTAMAAYAPAPRNNAAGHGAHSIRSGSNMGASSMPEPMVHASTSPADDHYRPGVGPQPYRDGVDGSMHPMVASPTSDAQGMYTYGDAGPGARRQPTGEYGHPTDYSGATFGGAAVVGGGHGGAHQYSSYEPQSTYPQQQQQRQASQSGTRMQSPPRLLPAIPPVSPIDQAANSGIPYGGGGGSGSDAASPSRRQATLDDGFGLTAAATTLAGQRGGSRSEAHASEDGYGGGGYDNYASSAYGHHGAVQGQGQGQHERLPTRYEDAREGSVGQYQHQHQGQGGYYDEGQSSTGPPGYDSAMGGGGGGGGYGHAHSHGGAGQYPPEKRG